MKVLIIIPAYNEAGNIGQVVNKVIENYPQYDYIVINDASRDKTQEICIKKGYHFIDQPINLGIGGTVQNGYQYALENDYDIVSIQPVDMFPWTSHVECVAVLSLK